MLPTAISSEETDVFDTPYNDIVCKIMGYLFLLELTGLSIFRCDTVKKLRKTTDE